MPNFAMTTNFQMHFSQHCRNVAYSTFALDASIHNVLYIPCYNSKYYFRSANYGYMKLYHFLYFSNSFYVNENMACTADCWMGRQCVFFRKSLSSPLTTALCLVVSVFTRWRLIAGMCTRPPKPRPRHFSQGLKVAVPHLRWSDPS